VISAFGIIEVMKVTKYPQSCLLIEVGNTRLVVDPGLHFSQKYSVDELGEIDAVLYTHQHDDHFDASLVSSFTDSATEIYANATTAELIGDEATVVEDGRELTIGDITVIARELLHCVMPDGSPGPLNTGYVIGGKLFHPGDGVGIEQLSINTLAAPIAGPSISPKTVFDFANQVEAVNIIPMHYDHWPQDPQLIKNVLEGHGFTVHVLEDGQSVEL